MSAIRIALGLFCLTTAAPAADLPVKRVTLYSSGVACYERSGTVDGQAAVEMPFKTEQINDILKSLVLIDFGGGRIDPVVYASQDPIEKSLKAFGIDLTKQPSLRALFVQLRGVPVELMLQAQADPVSGRILGAETHRVVDKHGVATDVEYVNLACDDGLRAFPIRDLRSARLLDDRLNTELSQALGVLAGSRDVGKKSVALQFSGRGERKVLAAYVLEAPVWKTSYRLVLSKSDPPLLQGWAMVDNTTDEDWRDVQLTLVSGRPISFTQDLYSPLYVPRPEVEPEIYASLRPQRYEGDMDEAARPEEERAAGRKLVGGMMKARRRGTRGAAPAEAAAGDFAFAVQAAPAAPAISALTAGIASMAETAEAGELFKYAIQTPVTIGRQKSAMLPIVNDAVGVEKLSIYNPGVHAKYPLNGLRLANSTDLNLMQGPMTVFDDGIYAGDAELDDLSPAEKRLISYAVDLEREVVVESESMPQRVTSVRIAKGTLIATNKYLREKRYTIKNKGDAPRTVLVEQPFEADWKLVEPAGPEERTGSLYRFKVDAVAGKSARLTVREERVLDQHIALRSTGPDTFQYYLRSKIISRKVRDALQQAVSMRTALERERREVERLKARLASIDKEQKRLRDNLRAVQQGSDLYRRYIAKLEKQETQIEQTQSALAEAEAKVERLRRELDDFLLGLDLE